MKFTYSTMRDYVATSLDAEALGDLLTMAGFELEGIEEETSEDPILDVKVMSNRGDGLSILGLAREVLAKDASSQPTELYLAAKFGFPKVATSRPVEALVRIDSALCNRFACVTVSGISVAPTPDWIKYRLERIGMRSISLLVDLTNYVMLEIGQPLHAYDLGKLGKEIVVREAQDGETIKTLDGVERNLTAGQLMICDASRPVGVAGVMGGFDTEVDDSTTAILLESAHFVNTSVRKTRKQLGLNTEASYRFERSVDPKITDVAIRRFLQLLTSVLPDVSISELTDVVRSEPAAVFVELELARASRLLGMEITLEEASRYLSALGFEILATEPLKVKVPSWRPDVVRAEDVVEELGRVHGYERIPEELPVGNTTMGGVHGKYRLSDAVVEGMIRQGYVQVVSHTLRSEHPLDSPTERVGPRNPGSPELALLRNSLLPGLTEAALRNGGKDVHLFEVGKIFEGDEDGHRELLHLAILSTGKLHPANRASEHPPVADFYSLKSEIEHILSLVGIRPYFEVGSAESGPLRATGSNGTSLKLMFSGDRPGDSRFHPGRSAYISFSEASPQSYVSGQFAPKYFVSIGLFGQIHPLAAEASDLPEATYLAEIWIDHAFRHAQENPQLKPISRNPAVSRDIAILIDKSVPFEKIQAAITSAPTDLLENCWLFDVYEGTGIPEGKHSLGIGLQFRKMGANLTDEEGNQARDAIVAAIVELGGILR
jgi:phenylalanyl-tRNA synthetase beta chain